MPAQNIPRVQKAVQQGEDGQVRVVSNAGVPDLPPGYALIKTAAVALNPSDWKIMKNFPSPGDYIGTDFSGTVVQAASDGSNAPLKPGTRVCGSTFGFSPKHRQANGAFAEYVRAHMSLLLRMPSGADQASALSSAQAATLGVALTTCIMSLWSSDALGLSGNPDSPLGPGQSAPVLVYGGSTATGTMALQLLRLSGYEAIATCSPRNFDLARDRGAAAVFDYASPQLAADIKARTGERLRYVLDCVSDAESVTKCYDAIQRPGGRYVSLEPMPDELLARRRAVQAKFVLAVEAYGEDIRLGRREYDRPASREKHESVVSYFGMIQRLLDLGKIRTHPMQLLDGGLEGVVRGLEILASGSVSGKKLVAVVGDSEAGMLTTT